MLSIIERQRQGRAAEAEGRTVLEEGVEGGVLDARVHRRRAEIRGEEDKVFVLVLAVVAQQVRVPVRAEVEQHLHLRVDHLDEGDVHALHRHLVAVPQALEHHRAV